jgi:hypothetical protein
VTEWVYAQADSAEELAELHYFSFKKRQPEGDIEFVITVKEFASRNALQMRFYAQATRRSTRRRAVPALWLGRSLLRALSECMDAIRQSSTIENSDHHRDRHRESCCALGASAPRESLARTRAPSPEVLNSSCT